MQLRSLVPDYRSFDWMSHQGIRLISSVIHLPPHIVDPKLRQLLTLNEKQDVDFNVYCMIANLQLNNYRNINNEITSSYLWIWIGGIHHITQSHETCLKPVLFTSSPCFLLPCLEPINRIC